MSSVRRALSFTLLVCLSGSAVGARAQYGAVAEVAEPIAATNDSDATASGTSLSLRDRPAAQESFSDVFPQLPGTEVMSRGSLGSFTTLTLRGTGPGQTAVMLGNLPLSGPDAGAFDFSLLPPSAFDRVEVYRGAAPAWFGNGAIGGVVRLLPHEARATSAGLSVASGSFGSYQVDGKLAAVEGRAHLSSSLGMRGTNGRYPFWNDGGTYWNRADDFRDHIRNGDSRLGTGVVHLTVEGRALTLEAVALAVTGERGVHGPYRLQGALHSREHDTRLFGAVGLTHQGHLSGTRGYEVQAAVSASYRQQGFDDRRGELGYGPRYTRDAAATLYGRLATRVDLAEWLEGTAVLGVRSDAFQPHDAMAPAQLPESSRLGAAGTMEMRLHGRLGAVPAELRPSVRLGYSRAQTHGYEILGAGQTTYRSGVFTPTYRVGAALGVRPWLSAAASFESGVRLPTIYELFGNRGSIQPSPDLAPERSTGFDAGLVAKGSRGPLHATAELRAFYTRVDDLIRFDYLRSTGTFKASNVASATLRGLEAGWNGAITEHVVLVGSITFRRSTDDTTGHALAFRAPLSAFARLELHSGAIRGRVSDLLAFADVSYQATTQVDRVGLQNLPSQGWLGLGIRTFLLARSLSVAFTVRDVLDRGGQDLLGYPLPGRRFWAQLAYHKDVF